MRQGIVVFLVALLWGTQTEASMRFRGRSIRDVVREANTVSTVSQQSGCPDAANTGEVHFTDLVESFDCDGDEGFTFTQSTNLVNINEATDGDSILLRLDNDQANSSGSKNETTQMRFGFGSDTDVARIIIGKGNDFTSANASDTTLALWVDIDNISTKAFVADGTALGGTAGVNLSSTQNPRNTLDIKGTLAVGSISSATTTAPTDGALIDGQVRIGDSESATFDVDDSLLLLPVVNSTSGIGQLKLQGQGNVNNPAVIKWGEKGNALIYQMQLYENDAASFDRAEEIFVWNNTSPVGYLSIQNKELSSAQAIAFEYPAFMVGELDDNDVLQNQTITITSGASVMNQRSSMFITPTINGIAGGPTETVTNAATVYINAAPSGSDITFTNGPYSLWVDDGAVRLDGALTVGSIDTGGGTALELAAGKWTPTTNNISNLDDSSAAEGQYLRVGATVTGSILLTVNPTLATTSTQLELDLPVASNFGATSDAAGSCGGDDLVSEVAGIRADATSNELEVLWVTTSLASHEISCAFSYQII